MSHAPFPVPPAAPSAPAAERKPGLALLLLPTRFGICRLRPDAPLPDWASGGGFSSVTRSRDELSIVCEERLVPEDVRAERGWRSIQVVGPLDFSLVGVLASLARPLAEARVSLFSISTFDTDYLLVRDRHLQRAIAALEAAGHRFDEAARAASRALVASAAAPPPPAPPEPVPVEPTLPEPIVLAPVEPVVPPESAEEEGADVALPERPEPFPIAVESAPLGEDEEDDDAEQDEEDGEDDDFDVDFEEGEEEEVEEEEVEEREEDDDVFEAEEELRPAVPADEVGELSEEDLAGLYAGAIPQHPVETVDRPFDALGLSPGILATVREIGFEHPTPIQAAVIPVALAGRDVVGLAMTGSGKTAAFALPLAEKLHHGEGIRGLILSPTREIALQTKAFLDIFGRDHALDTAIVIGGVRMGPQIDALRRTPDIVVATPGRLADHLRRRNLRLDAIEHVVLDEADHMLDLGFWPQIKEILEQVPEVRQTMMFSATMPPLIANLARKFLRDPERIDFRPAGAAAAGIEHRLYLVNREEDKVECLRRLLDEVAGSTLVFARRKLDAEWLGRQLEKRGVPVERIHSDRSQVERVRALRRFREGEVRVLVATDVAARGIDIPRTEHVVNYEVPDQVEDYIHRAGRTARGAALGIVSTIATWQDKPIVTEIEDVLGKPIPRRTVAGVEPYQEVVRRPNVRRRRLL